MDVARSISNREVIFFFNIGGFVKINGADLLALFPGLLGDQNIAEHGLGFFLGIVRGMHDVHPSLVAVFKGSLTPSTRMNLGFLLQLAFLPGGLRGLESNSGSLWATVPLGYLRHPLRRRVSWLGIREYSFEKLKEVLDCPRNW